VQGRVGLGHQRLTIVDLSDAASQPMSSASGATQLVFNGEIYNYIELKRHLLSKRIEWRSASDTEVLLELFEAAGPASLKLIDGMFAFAVWDARIHTLVLVRDRVGIKPLYYYYDEHRLVFASEIKALLQCSFVTRAMAPTGLLTYLSFGYSIAPHTIFRGIRKLRPGYYLTCNVRGVTEHQYWDVPNTGDAREVSEADAAPEVRSLLTSAVRSNMTGDVPIGAFLSGGIDSSAVVALMTQAGHRVKTFAVGFDVGGHFDELADARSVARTFGTDHYEATISAADVERLIERLAYHFDEPFADAANVPTLAISALARQHVKVVLTGEGGDELFGGYRRYRRHLATQTFGFLRRVLSRGVLNRLSMLFRSRRISAFLRAVAIRDEAARYGMWHSLFSCETQAELVRQMRGELESFDAHAPYRQLYNRASGWDSVNRMLYTDLKGLLPDLFLEKVDKASMAESLEARVPFLDHHLVEYAFSLPGRLKVKGPSTKHILKLALEGVLPGRTLVKPKHGFEVPLDIWFRGRLKTLFGDVCLATGAANNCFETATVERIYRQHLTGERDWGMQLWTILNYQLWHNTYMQD
jgi:asparagine synthase (glutamine-hydrolysing)